MAGSSVARHKRSRTELKGWKCKVVEDGRKNSKNGNFAAGSSKRSGTELKRWKVVDHGRKIDRYGNFAAGSSKMTTKKRKGSEFAKKSSKRAVFFRESSSSSGESNDTVSGSSESSSDGDEEPTESTEDTDDESSSEDDTSDDNGGLKLKPSSKVKQSVAAEVSSESSSEESSESFSPSESSSSEFSESEKQAEAERRPEVIDVSSGDEETLSSEQTLWRPAKTFPGPAYRTRSKKSTITSQSHYKPESSRKWTEPSSVSNQKKKTEKKPRPRHTRDLHRRISRNFSVETSRKVSAKSSRNSNGKISQLEKSDRVSDMFSSTRPSSEEEVQCEVVSEKEDAVLPEITQVTEERMNRKEKLRSALKSSRRFSQLLMDSMWQKEDEIAILTQPEPPSDKVWLPRKFNFRTEVKKPEKTEEEKELDPIWMEMELALNIPSSVVQEEEVVEPGMCAKGKHRLQLNEEIGLICLICSHVETEIKNIFPSFADAEPSSKRRYREDYDNRRPLHDLNMENESEGGSNEAQFAETGTVWDLVPKNIRTTMFPHQKEGFEFMWKNIGGSIDLVELRNSGENIGGGCIISHAPGTGKTRLTLVFLKAYTQAFPESNPIVIAPASMLLTWEEEFHKCKIDIPFHNLNNDDLSMNEKHEILKLVDENSHLKMNRETTRSVKLYSWSKTPSVLGISYSLFVKLVGSEKTSKILLEKPGVVVLDEGHTPRNGDSSVWNTLCRLKTKKRIILSGTPFQNNCNELRNTMKIVRPIEENLVATKLDSLKGADDSDRKAAILKDAISPFAHVYKGSILQKDLPGLRNCAVVLNPTEFQLKILQTLQTSPNTFELEHKQALVTVHPSLVLNCKLSEKENLSIETNTEILKSCRKNPDQGAKARFVLNFVRLALIPKEKVLVFGQYKEPLKLIMEQLISAFNWSEGREVFIMSGDIDQKQRQNMIVRFNDPGSDAKVLLASIKACSEGINLVGASRVILLDVVWNPSVERQAISRAYRLGQKKVVYTYHLMMKGSSDGDRYVKQAKKQRLSEFMFSTNGNDIVVGPPVSTEDMLLEIMTCHSELKELFHEVIFQPRENNLMEKFCLVD